MADYRCFNSSNVSIRPWSWNYRSCWHQTCPPVDTHHCVWIASIPSPAGVKGQRDCCGSSLPPRCVWIGQFARLLPTLVVVAVSQAPSPESNPDSPLPVTATVVHYTTVRADRSEVRVIKQCVRPPRGGRAAPTLCQHGLSHPGAGAGRGPPRGRARHTVTAPTTDGFDRDQPESTTSTLPSEGTGLTPGWVLSATEMAQAR